LFANINSGPNYVGYLTTKYNASLVFTYNIASGGATVDAALAKPYLPTVHSLIDQVTGDFMPAYGVMPTSRRRVQWTGDDSLFLFFIGINDVLNTYNANNPSLVAKIFSEYTGLVEQVYSSGARNFLFLDVPPLQKSPMSQKYPASLSKEQAALKNWASRLDGLASALKSRHPEVMARTFSTYNVFDKIIENPRAFPQTSNLKEIADFCDQYSK
jgi:phospholipase/lecithinase/hemolysin